MTNETPGEYGLDTIYQALPLGFVTMLSAELAARGRDVDAYEYICQEMPDKIRGDFETIARIPGCSQPAFSVSFGS